MSDVMRQWLTGQDNPEPIVNANFKSLEHMVVYAMNPETTTGLTWGYLGGRWAGFAITAGTVLLAATNTNYVVVARATGVVSVATSTTNWNNTTDYARVYLLTTGASTVTGIQDFRSGAGGVHGIISVDGALVGLSDVDPSGLTDGDVLIWNAATSKWEPGAGGGGGGPTYATGTFTPVLVGVTSAGVGTYATQTGAYTKIGRMVHVRGTLIWTAHTGAGQMRITGLPFTSATGVNQPLPFYLNAVTFTGIPALLVGNNSTQASLWSQATNANVAAIAMDGTGTIEFSGCYEAT